MMKISEDDLKKLFDEEEISLGPDENWKGFVEKEGDSDLQGNVKIKKIRKFDEDNAKISDIRKNLSKIKEPPPPKKKEKRQLIWVGLLKFVAYAGITGFLVFILLNTPSYIEQFKWSYYTQYLGKGYPEDAVVANKPIQLGETALVSPTATPARVGSALPSGQRTPLPTPVPAAVSASSSPGNLVIDKINVNSPVIWNVDESEILKNLKGGVVHYKGTSLPGGGGNVFIVGHSSNYFWVKSNYNHVFALLDKLVNGDRIVIQKDGSKFVYKVVDKKVVSPNNIEVLNSTNKEILTLMTCWPVGTSLNRLIVQSELISAN